MEESVKIKWVSLLKSYQDSMLNDRMIKSMIFIGNIYSIYYLYMKYNLFYSYMYLINKINLT